MTHSSSEDVLYKSVSNCSITSIERAHSGISMSSLPDKTSSLSKLHVSSNAFGLSKYIIPRSFSHSLTSISTGVSVGYDDIKQQVLSKLTKVFYPDLQRNIVELGFVQQIDFSYVEKKVHVELLQTFPFCATWNFLVDQCEFYLKKLNWVKEVKITFIAKTVARSIAPGVVDIKGKNLKDVESIICVSSCKGGVGKSSISVNLAFMLSRLGAKVGILDADICGPSLHTFLHLKKFAYFVPNNSTVDTSENGYVKKDSKKATKHNRHFRIQYEHDEHTITSNADDEIWENRDDMSLLPLEYRGVKLMSYSFIRKQGKLGFSALNGPMVGVIFSEMLLRTTWGKLDYLIIDMPPGTSDVHICFSNTIHCDANIVVTTPHTLSIVDVEKGLRMFNDLRIPTVGIVENMAYFLCMNCNEQHHIFNSHRQVQKITEDFGIAVFVQLPLHDNLSSLKMNRNEKPITERSTSSTNILNNDSSKITVNDDIDLSNCSYPFALAFNESNKKMTEDIVKEVAAIKFGARTPVISIRNNCDIFMTVQKVIENYSESYLSSDELSYDTVEEVYSISCLNLRMCCQCAECIDIVDGTCYIDHATIDENIRVLKISKVGNRTITFYWSDGHFTVISYKQLEKLCKQFGTSSGPSVNLKHLTVSDNEW